MSSAFNTIQRDLLIQKLHPLNTPPILIHLLHNFLSDRQQPVRVGTTTSPSLTTNTGASQGSVLSPFSYNDCTSPSHTTTCLKYSDDTAILALLSDTNSVLDYHNTVTHFSKWCTHNHLHLNISKTKE